MSDESFIHKIRADLGKAFHHKHTNPDGKVDIESIATENGVSQDQVQEQMDFLRHQNLIAGPMANEGLQVRGVPDQHNLTDDGLAWSMAGYPVL